MDEHNHQESTQEQEYSSEATDNCTEPEECTQSTADSTQPSQSANSNFKHFPVARPCTKYDSDSRMNLIQGAYDASFVAARRKKANIEK